MSTAVERGELYRLVDLLPERDLSTAERVLRGLLALEDDSVLRVILCAPEDTEPTLPDEEAAVQRARDDLRQGRVHTQDEARRLLLAEE